MLIKFLNPRRTIKLMSFWPPYLGTGISVKTVNSDLTSITVQMKQRFYNTNYVGSHFGGSLYSMCDPFYMFILLHHLRDDHIVWDQAAEIEFVSPGKGTISVDFTISPDEINTIKSQALEKFSLKPVFYAEIKDKNQEVVAKLKKTLYVRRKDAKELFK